MLLAGRLHRLELPSLEFVPVDVSPVEGRCVHGETGRDRAIGPDDDVVLATAAIPLGKVHLAIGMLDNPWSARQMFCHISVCARSVAVPSDTFQFIATGHSDECFDLLQA